MTIHGVKKQPGTMRRLQWTGTFRGAAITPSKPTAAWEPNDLGGLDFLSFKENLGL